MPKSIVPLYPTGVRTHWRIYRWEPNDPAQTEWEQVTGFHGYHSTKEEAQNSRVLLQSKTTSTQYLIVRVEEHHIVEKP